MADYTIKVVISSDAKDLIGALQKSGVQIEKFEKGAEGAATKSKNWGAEILKLGGAIGLGMGIAQLTTRTTAYIKESLEASRATAAARGALVATVGSLDEYQKAIDAARLATNGMVSEQELASSVNIMLATGLETTYEGAGKLSQEGAVLTQVFSAAGATQEKFTRLLQSGNLVLYDNFGLTQDMVNARKALIVASGEAQGEEAKLLAIRQLLHESATKYMGTLDESVVASAQFKAATQDLKAALGDALMPTVTDVTIELAKLARLMADTPQIVASQRQEIFEAAESWEQYKAVMMATGYSVDITKSEFEALKAPIGDVTHESWRLKEAQEAVRYSLEDTTEAADDQLTTLRYYRDETGKWQQEQIDDAWELVDEQSKADDWAQYHRYEYYEKLGDYYGDYLKTQEKGLAEEQKQAEEREKILEEQLDNLNELNTALANYYQNVADAQDDALQSEADYHASIGELQSSANATREEAEQALSEKLADIEQQRQDKIAWVQTGAWDRTAEGEAEAEAFHNAIYDQMRDEAIAKTQEKVAGVLAAEAEKEAALAAQYEREKAQQAAALEDMKLNAALALIEQAGLLGQFTSGMATNAADAAEMIKAGIIPVTEEMGLVIQSVLGDMAAGQEEAATNAQANADVLSQALAGTIDENVIPSMENMKAAQEEMWTGFVDRAYNEVVPALAEDGIGGAFTALTEEKIPAVNTAHEELMANMVKAMDEFLAPAIENVDLSFDDIAITTLPNVQSAHTAMAGSVTGELNTIGSTAADASSTMESGFSDAAHTIDDKLNDALKDTYDWLIKVKKKADEAAAAIRAMNALGPPPNNEGQHGLDMTVPPGFPGDTFPLWATSGERVQITPAGQTTNNRTNVVNNYFNQVVNTQADTSTVIHDYAVMRTLLS